MATIVTRSGKGSPLTNAEVDGNFTNLNTELGTKANTSSLATVATSGAYSDLTGKPTNVSSFSNDSGYITGITSGNVTTALGFTPYDATNPASYITSAGSISGNAATATNISNTGTVTLASATESNSIYATAPSYGADQPTKLLNFDWYSNVFSLGNIRSTSTDSNGFGVYYTATGGSRAELARFLPNGNFGIGTVTAPERLTIAGNIRIGNAGEPNVYNINIVGRSPAAGTIDWDFKTNDATYGARTPMTISATGSVVANFDVRAPIFYDSNDTGYYVDAASNSALYQLTTGVGINLNGGIALVASGATLANSIGARLTESYGPVWNLGDGATWHHQVINGSMLCGFSALGTNWGSGNIIANGYLRGTLFYDQSDTGYYIDPSSNAISVRTNGSWITNPTSTWGGDVAGKLEYHNNRWYASVNTAFVVRSTTGSEVFWAYNTGVAEASNDFRAPIFYDSNNTAYYIDPSSTSQVSGANFNFGATGRVYDDGNFHIDGLNSPVWINSIGNSTIELNTQTSGYVNIGNSARAPIYYDSANTAYYVDPASTSNLVGLTVANTITGSINGTAAKATDLDQARYVNNDFNTLGTSPQVFRAYTNYIPSGGSYNQPTGTGDFKVLQWGDVQGGTSGNWGGQIVQNFYDDRMWFRRSYTTTWQAWREFIHDGNYTSFAMPIGSSATNSVDVRAPIFYDSNDTAYYINPNDNSRLLRLSIYVGQEATGAANSSVEGLVMRGNYNSNSWAHKFHKFDNGSGVPLYLSATVGDGVWTARQGWGSGLSYTSQVFGSFAADSVYSSIFYDTNNTNYYVDPASNSQLNTVSLGAGSKLHLVSLADPNHFLRYAGTGFSGVITDGPQLAGHQGGELATNMGGDNWSLRWDASGNTFSRASSRAGIFYDSNETAFYIDPNSTSRLNNLSLNTVAVTSGITGLTSAPITTQYANAGATNTWYPMTYQRAQHSGGYVTHLNTGLYKDVGAWGSGATGWYAAIGGSDASPTQAWYLTYDGLIQNSLGYVSTGGSFRAPTFYDSQNTNYYLDPVSGFYLGGDGSTTYQSTGSGLFITNPEGTGAVVRLGAAWSRAGSYSNGSYTLGSESSIHFWISNSQKGYIDSASNLLMNGSVQAPIFYDSANTGFYADPNSTSRLERLVLSARYDNYFVGSMAVVNAVSNFQTLTDTFGQMSVMQVSDTGGFTNGPTGLYPYGAVMSWRTENHSYQMYASHTGDLAYKTQWNNDNYTGWQTPVIYGRIGNSASGRSIYGSVYYDTDNTGFYIDPATGSYLSGATFTDLITGRNSPSTDVNTANDTGSISIRGSTTTVAAMSFHRAGAYAINMGLGTDNVFRIGGWSAQSNCLQVFGSGVVQALNDFRAPIFYDSNDTARYLDPTSVSSLAGAVLIGPNSSGKYTRIGGNGGATDMSTVSTSNGNLHLDAESGSNIYLAWYNTSTINVGGSLSANGNITAYSDIRVKANVETIPSTLDKLDQIRGVTYTRTDLEDKERRYAGVIAQDIEAVLPEAVFESDGRKSVDYNAIIGLLIQAVKELRDEVEMLRK